MILRPGKTPDGAEVARVLRHLVKAIRARWPKVEIVIRGDSHYARPQAMAWLERNRVRLLVHTAAYWLLHTLKGLAPKTSFWRDAQFDAIRLAFVKIAARVTEKITRIKVSLPSGYPDKQSLANRALALPP